MSHHHALDITDTLVSALEGALDLDYAKNHIRSLTDADDNLIAIWIEAATSYFFEQTGRSPLTQTRIALLDQFPFYGVSASCARIELPHPPLQSVTNVQYLDANGVLRSFNDGGSPLTNYFTYTAPVGDYAACGPVEPIYGMTWPQARCQTGSVRITYTCGYASDADGVPPLIRNILCFLVAHFDQFRSAVHEARRGQVLELPYGIETLMDAFKFTAQSTQILRVHGGWHSYAVGPWGPWV